jgi:uncharacterized protein (DUF849 family)
VGTVVAAIRRAAPGIEVGVTTARWVEPNPFRRTELVARWGQLPPEARPDVASVNVHERGWDVVCAALESAGIGVELGVWTTGDAVQLKQAGVPRGTVRVLAEVTVTDPDSAVPEAVRILRALGPLPVPVLLHGEEGGAWPVLDYARRRNLDTRIGFEDTVVGPDGRRPASGNEELVRHAVGAAASRLPIWPGRSRRRHAAAGREQTARRGRRRR